MSIRDLMNDSSTEWQREPPASETAIQNLVSECELDLPSAYLEFLMHSNGAEGELSVSPGSFVIWPVEGVLEQNLEIAEYLPGFFAFGDDGGLGGMLAFDMQTPQPWKIYHFEWSNLNVDEGTLVAPDFETFVSFMGKPYINRRAPASEATIQNLVSESGLDLPSAYLEFLRQSNGAEGDLPVEPYWFVLWRADRVTRQNKNLKIIEYAPNFFAFGDNGGNELFAFDTRSPQPWKVYTLRLIPMIEDDALGKRPKHGLNLSTMLHIGQRFLTGVRVKRGEEQIARESSDAREVAPNFETFVDYMGKRYTDEEEDS